jgi:hypothetical protein
MIAAGLLAAPLVVAVGIGATVEHCHGLIGRADLNLNEISIRVLALYAFGYNRV